MFVKEILYLALGNLNGLKEKTPISKVSEAHLYSSDQTLRFFRLQGLLIDSLRHGCDTWYSVSLLMYMILNTNNSTIRECCMF